MRFALLRDLELRLVDRMFALGALRDVPVVVRPPADLGPAEPRTAALVPLAAQVDATAQRVGDVVEHGSIDELLRIAAQLDVGPRRRRRAHP
ncbi:MAG: hypothetical protein R2702_06480 [Acidimicrobiales bacterium]